MKWTARNLMALVFTGTLAITVPAQALTLTSMVGDNDIFGIPGAPAESINGKNYITDLGGAFFNDYRTPGDPPHTDIWFSTGVLGVPVWTHTYNLGGGAPLSGVLQLNVAGIADTGLVRLLADGVEIGTMNFPNGGTTAHELFFPVPLHVLDGSTLFTFSNGGGPFEDSFIIDFTKLTIETDVIPEPSTWLLLGTGLAGIIGWRLRKTA